MLSRLPTEVLDNVAFYYACPQLVGTPVALTSILLVCKHVNDRLRLPRACLFDLQPEDNADGDHGGNPVLYARIFRFKFSANAIRRRSFTPTARQYAKQLVHYTSVLHDIDNWHRNTGRRINNPLQTILFTALLMLLEDDGSNKQQLEHVDTYGFIMQLVLGRPELQSILYISAEHSGGWPVERVDTSCALWVLWMLSTRERVLAESATQTNVFISLIWPFVCCPFRYATAYAPPNHFYIPLSSSPRTIRHYVDTEAHVLSNRTEHGAYPVYYNTSPETEERDTSSSSLRPSMTIMATHYGRQVSFTVPPSSSSAKLLYLTRREKLPAPIMPNLPVNREDAIAQGRTGATQEDIIEWNTCITRFQDFDMPEKSKVWDNEYSRMRFCENAWNPRKECDNYHDSVAPSRGGDWDGELSLIRPYDVGSLHGLWGGSLIVMSEPHYQALLRRPAGFPPTGPIPIPRDFTDASMHTASTPLFMRLREHVSFPPAEIAPCGGPCPLKPPKFGDNLPLIETLADFQAEFDQGMLQGYFPGEVSIKPTLDEQGVVVDRKYEYLTWHDNLCSEKHDPQACNGCDWRERQMRRMRRLHELVDGDRLFESVGLGVGKGVAEFDGEDDPGDSEDTDDEHSEVPIGSPVLDHQLAERLKKDEDNMPHDPQNIAECNGIQDIIITGETDARHAAAWSGFTVRGRIRAWDGLIGLLRIPNNRMMARTFLYGHIIGGRNFVGNWRTVATPDLNVPAWEGSFILGKITEPTSTSA